MRQTSAVEPVDASVPKIRRAEGEDTLARMCIMILAEQNDAIRLPIWIGPTEATVLALALESARAPRPFAYKLAASRVDAAGITSPGSPGLLRGDRAGPGEAREVDSRASDAVNLALVTGAPIRIGSELLNLVSVDYPNELDFCLIARAEVATVVQQRLGERDRAMPSMTSGSVVHG